MHVAVYHWMLKDVASLLQKANIQFCTIVQEGNPIILIDTETKNLLKKLTDNFDVMFLGNQVDFLDSLITCQMFIDDKGMKFSRR